jgi:hypothetical protein
MGKIIAEGVKGSCRGVISGNISGFPWERNEENHENADVKTAEVPNLYKLSAIHACLMMLNQL